MKNDVVRPWGHFRPLWNGFKLDQDRPASSVKILCIQPGHQTSLQRHAHREEHWVVVSGEGELTTFRYSDVNAIVRPISSGYTVTISRMMWHRVSANGPHPLVIAEVQLGECWEEDIERQEDDYGRAPVRGDKVACAGLNNFKDRG